MEDEESKSQSPGQDIQIASENVEGKILTGHESFKSTSEHVNSPVKNDALKVKEANVHDPDVLLEKISDLEKEAVGLWEQIQNLIDENETLKAEKANVADLKLRISESDRKIETMGKEIEGSRKQVLTAEDEISKLKEEQTELLNTIEPIEQKSALLNEQLGLQQNRESELEEKVKLALAEIANRDEQIAELNTQIDELKNSHAAEENRWNTDMKRLKTDLRRNYEREVSALKKENKNLTEENAMIESMKANVAELKDTISECNRKIETSGKVLEAYRKDLLRADDEISKLKEKLSNKIFDLNQFLSVGDAVASLQKQLESKEVRDLELREKVMSFTAEISKRDDEITQLNTKIFILRISHATEEDKWRVDTEKLKTELSEKCELIDDLKQKHDERLESQEAMESRLREQDEGITELNSKIDLVKASYAAEEGRWNADLESLKREVGEKCEFVDDLNRKHEALISCTYELKLKVGEMERAVEVMAEEKREVIRQLSFSLDHYMSSYKQLRKAFVAICKQAAC